MKDKKIKAVVFDWHGVLDRGHFSAVVGKAYREYKRDKKWLKFIRFARHGRKYRKLFGRYNRGLISPQEFWGNVYADLGVRSAKVFEDLVKNFLPLEEGWEFLEKLKEEYSLYILSDCPVDKREVIDDVSGVDVFEEMFFSCDYGMMKDAKDGVKFFKLFEEKTGLNAEELVFFDDNPRNVKKARQAGWQAFTFKVDSISRFEKILLG